MTAFVSDLRGAIRALAAARRFAAIAILTLAVGLALCVSVLAVVNAYVVRALPYPAADRLYRVDYAAPGQNPPRGLETLDWTLLSDIVEFPVAWDLDVFYLLGGQYPQSAPGAWITMGYVHALGIQPAFGRTFAPSDFQPGNANVAIVSHGIWQTRFGGDPDVLGRSFQAYVSDRREMPETFMIVGVLPPDFWHLNAYTEVLAPLKLPSYPYMMRLREGVSPQLAGDRITALVRSGIATLPTDWRPVLTSTQASYTAAARPMFWAVGAAAALVLLIACANVAVLLLIRGRHRQKEFAVRLALGASHSQLARLLAIEALVLGTAATILGTTASHFAMQSLGRMIEQFLERRAPGGLEAFSLDYKVVAAAALCGLAVTFFCTLVALISTRRVALVTNLSSVGRGATEGARSRRTQSLLIGVEIAASLTLLVGAALMAESALRMLRVEFGIADDVVTASLTLRQRSYPDAVTRMAFYDRLLSQLEGVGGGRSVALGNWWPLQGSRPRRVDTVAQPPTVGGANIFAVTGEYFATLGITLREGRTFDRRDRIGSDRVLVISESLARRLWPDTRAIGQQLLLHPDGEGEIVPHTVIGVVSDTRQSHGDTHLFDAYIPLAHYGDRFAFIYVRGPQSPRWEAELRAAAAAVDPEVAMGTPRRLQLGLDQERVKPRFLALLLAVFAWFACGLALVGVHGVIAYAVRHRQREIAVRIAVGADARSVTNLFLRQGSVVLLAGLVAGLAGALGLGRVLQSQLYGVQPGEPRLLAAAALAMGLCGLLAMWWPAWRAASTDPAVVLKEE
jgi:putative ABC transport system permease protein